MTASSATVRQALPTAVAEGSDANLRGSKYGEPVVIPLLNKNHQLAADGSYFVTTNPTPGTGIAYAVTAAASETAGYFLAIINGSSAGDPSAKTIFLDYLRLIPTVAPASGTSGRFAWRSDVAAKYTSGGSALTPVNPNSGNGNTSVASVKAGALTTAAASGVARLISHGVLRGAIPVVNDEYVFDFGGAEAAGGSIITSGTNVQRMGIPVPPIVIGPGMMVGLQLWFPSNAVTGLSAELELAHWER